MSCILRVYSRRQSFAAFLAGASFKPYRTWIHGQQEHHRVFQNSGFAVVTSEAEFNDPWQQVQDTGSFLKAHQDSLERLSVILTQESEDEAWMELDFGIEDRVGMLDEHDKRIALQSDYFPPDLIRLMGHFGIALTVSHYP